MKKAAKTRNQPEMLKEYDFSNGVRGKYAERFKAGTNLVLLAPDVQEHFPDSDSVNEALRSLVLIGDLLRQHDAKFSITHKAVKAQDAGPRRKGLSKS